MNTKSLFRISVLAILFATIVTSCKKKYEAPPETTDPNLTPTTTIAALKAMHTVPGKFDVINTDIIIAGVVIANDKSGNLYKEMYIRDNTGAIAVELSGTLYTNYPVGKKVYIKCNGLCLSDYNNMIQLGVKAIINGSPSLESVPAPLIDNYVIGGSLNNPALPKVVTQADLTLTTPYMQFPLLGDLIQLNDYEFLFGDTKKTFGDTSSYKKAGEVYIKGCGSSSALLVRTSGYADFAAKNPQAGNGSFAAIFTTYGTTRQFVLRDTTDIKFTGVRCNLFEEDFQAYTTSGTSCWNIANWQNIKESGDVCFTLSAFGSNIFPKISAFNSAVLSTTNIKTWLIAPPITLQAGIAPKYTFTCSRRYTVGTFKALISTDYNGSATPATATWTELGTVPANASNAAPFTPFETFGPYNLAPYAGQKIYLAFRYEVPAGTSAGSAGTFEPDDMKISKN